MESLCTSAAAPAPYWALPAIVSFESETTKTRKTPMEKKKTQAEMNLEKIFLQPTWYELASTFWRMEISSTALPQNCESSLKNRSWSDPSGPPQDEVSGAPARPRLCFTPVKSRRRSLTPGLPACIFLNSLLSARKQSALRRKPVGERWNEWRCEIFISVCSLFCLFSHCFNPKSLRLLDQTR